MNVPEVEVIFRTVEDDKPTFQIGVADVFVGGVPLEECLRATGLVTLDSVTIETGADALMAVRVLIPITKVSVITERLVVSSQQ